MKTALLIIDIQNDYFPGGASPLYNPEHALKNVKKVLHYFREQELPVIFVQHVSTRPTATFFLPDTFGVKIHDEIAPLPDEKIMIKHFPNSFRNTELLDYLTENKIEELIICGMMTHMCVDATVRAAMDHGFECTLLSDGCATKDLEINGNKINASEVQHSFLAALNYFYAKIIHTKDFLSFYK
jgi:nicotinamidase-related amidase